LLDIGQIDSGSLRLALAPGDLVALTRDALAQFERGATHQIVLDAPESLAVAVDPVRFEQVVTVLLANAVKFSPAGSTVTVEIAETDDGAAQLAVTDEGRGVSPEHRELIFERFQQAHGRHYQAGLGLSLPIARRIVELHGGSIHVEPAPSGGARFVTRLPGAPRI
jgi:signal transduction histidine kinase